MAIQTAEAKLYTGSRCWVVDKNISANLTSTFTTGNKNRPIESGDTVYPGILAHRLYKTTADLKIVATINRVDERYKTYGGGNNVITVDGVDNTQNWKVTSGLVCKFPTYIQIDVDKLGIPEGTDCIVDIEEGWITEGDYPGSTFAPNPEVKNFFTFRTPWFGVGRLNTGAFSATPIPLRIKQLNPQQRQIVSTLTAYPIFNPGKLAALFGGVFLTTASPVKTVTHAFPMYMYPEWYINAGYLLETDAQITNEFNITLPEILRVRRSNGILISTTELQSIIKHYIGIISWQQANFSSEAFGVKTVRPTANFVANFQRVINASANFVASSQMNITTTMTSNVSAFAQQLYVFGLNDNYQLGTGSPGNVLTPQTITNISGWTMTAGGKDFSLAISKIGHLYAWGNNANGRTGLGISFGTTTTPTRIGTASNWNFICAGEAHAFAINTAGELYAWGLNSSGQLGLGDTTDRTSPTRVGTGTDWLMAAAGKRHSLFIKQGTNRDLWVAGNNSLGQLGVPALGTQVNTISLASVIDNDPSFISISAGDDFSLAIVGRSGARQLYAWGLNSNGQLGLGDTTNRTSPRRVGTYDDWWQISTGQSHCVGIRMGFFGNNVEYRMYSWGNNANGRTGLGTYSGNTLTPTLIDNDPTWSYAVAADTISLSVKSGGIYSFGWNYQGRTGLGTSDGQTLTPTLISTIPSDVEDYLYPFELYGNHSLIIRNYLK